MQKVRTPATTIVNLLRVRMAPISNLQFPISNLQPPTSNLTSPSRTAKRQPGPTKQKRPTSSKTVERSHRYRYPCQELNLGLSLRRAALYPLSYRGVCRATLRRLGTFARFVLSQAGRQGFEPWVQFYPHNRLAGGSDRPLRHLPGHPIR